MTSHTIDRPRPSKADLLPALYESRLPAAASSGRGPALTGLAVFALAFAAAGGLAAAVLG